MLSDNGLKRLSLKKYVLMSNQLKIWESDVSIPAAASIKKLCFLFHTTSDYLLEIDDRPVVTLDRLSEREAIRARKLFQLFIDTAPNYQD